MRHTIFLRQNNSKNFRDFEKYEYLHNQAMDLKLETLQNSFSDSISTTYLLIQTFWRNLSLKH